MPMYTLPVAVCLPREHGYHLPRQCGVSQSVAAGTNGLTNKPILAHVWMDMTCDGLVFFKCVTLSHLFTSLSPPHDFLTF